MDKPDKSMRFLRESLKKQNLFFVIVDEFIWLKFLSVKAKNDGFFNKTECLLSVNKNVYLWFFTSFNLQKIRCWSE